MTEIAIYRAHKAFIEIFRTCLFSNIDTNLLTENDFNEIKEKVIQLEQLFKYRGLYLERVKFDIIQPEDDNK